MNENNNTPQDVAENLGNILNAQKKSMEEPVQATDVKNKIKAPSMHVNEESKPTEETSKFITFKGFNYSKERVAKSEVSLPILRTNLRLSPIVFKEELALAQTLIEDKDITMDVLQLLYSHIVEGREVFTKSFESFVKHLLEDDLMSLLYGFFINSYGTEVVLDKSIPCSKCGHKHKIEKLNLIEIYNETPFDGDELSALKFEKECNLSEYGIDATFYLKFNNMESTLKRQNISKNNFLNEIASGDIINHVDRFEHGGTIFKDNNSIKNAVDTLNSDSRKAIKTCIKENFEKYGMKLKYKWTCKGLVPDPDALKENARKECSHTNEIPIQINELFFREISESIS
jgi:hypothetical protein